MTNVFTLPRIRAGFGNKILSLMDALAQCVNTSDVIATRDHELLRVYRGASNSSGAKPFPHALQLSETLFRNPSIDLSQHFFVVPEEEVIPDTLALHFRGRDFAAWKPHSIIETEFFIRQIETVNREVNIWLFSDDWDHAVVRMIEAHATEDKRTLLRFNGSMFSDFSMLARASQIVASPSTFSLCAGILGGKRIIFPRNYAEVEARAGVEFWSRLAGGEQPSHIRIDLK